MWLILKPQADSLSIFAGAERESNARDEVRQFGSWVVDGKMAQVGGNCLAVFLFVGYGLKKRPTSWGISFASGSRGLIKSPYSSPDSENPELRILYDEGTRDSVTIFILFEFL